MSVVIDRCSRLALPILLASGCAVAPPVSPPAAPAPAIALVDVAETAGLVHPVICGSPDKPDLIDTNGTGVAILDADGDGRMDIFVVHGSSLAEWQAGPTPDRLYRNLGAGRFEEIGAAAGVDDRAYGSGALAWDYDADGDPDLFVTDFGSNRLYRNDGHGRFTDVADEVGLRGSGWSMGAAAADADGDGDLDLYVTRYVVLDPAHPPRGRAQGGERDCQWKGADVACGPLGLEAQADRYYRNDRGRFVDRTAEAGFGAVKPGFGMGVIFTDLSGDGRPDVYVANDAGANFFFRNRGDGTFVEEGRDVGLAFGSDGVPRSGMGIAHGDADGDGWPELLVTNFSDQPNSFFRTEDGEVWDDVGTAAGLAAPSVPRLGWGTVFFDVDSDGDQDLYVGNGHVYPEVDRADPATSYRQRNQLYLNDGSGRFAEAPAEGHLAAATTTRGVARVDFDDDGDFDLVASQLDARPLLLRNDSIRQGNWIGLRLVGKGSNRDAADARVEVEAGGRRQVFQKLLGSSYLSSEDPRILVAIGDANQATVHVTWPNGSTQDVGPLPAGQYHRIAQE